MSTLSRRHFIALSAASAAAAAAYTVHSNRVQVTRPRAPRHATGREEAPLRVAHLSDLHAPRDYVDARALAAAVAAFRPDLVVMTGDVVDRRGNEELVGMLGALDARLGSYAVLGNWEREGGCSIERLRAAYDRAGFRLLVNERVALAGDAPVELVGLDDVRTGTPQLALVAAPPRDGARRLVLSHCPATFDTIVSASACRVDVLAGHTHGGQIAPLGVAIFTPHGSGPYVHGWYGRGGHRMYVSRGLGNSLLPFRIGARPELALLEL